MSPRLASLAATPLLSAILLVGPPGHAPAARMPLAGLPNLGRVSATILRGAQPTPDGLRRLRALGVRVVVDLRAETDQIATERTAVEALGMRFVSVPMSGWRTPTDEQVGRALAELRRSEDAPVFVHCRRGAERTGLVIAAWRIAHEGWTTDEALAEMKAYHFRWFLYPNLVHWVRALPARLAASDGLRLAPVP